MEAIPKLNPDEREAILSRYQEIMQVLSSYSDARLIAVSKRQPIERLACLVEAGHKDFGENYLQEWQLKRELFPEDLNWHFVGSVQSRKVKRLISDGIHCIHGIGSESSLAKLNQSEGFPKGGCLLQLNLAGEEQKGGVSENVLDQWYGEGLLASIQGIMCIPPAELNEQALAEFFKAMKHLQLKYQFKELSMGMSSDYRIALEEGATMIRVGSKIFGERQS